MGRVFPAGWGWGRVSEADGELTKSLGIGDRDKRKAVRERDSVEVGRSWKA